ncbi:hypothetical protein C3492_42535 [Streptomyces sp. Ru62]|uniref:hypothetical protein n=1 Tax=Streptomyces sp. Ru62 TaxID=2080745 RepID=UPI000CDD4121|nr:hypothetical protein [Streptomyces sp. Ru62]POX57599.1 hypothetical protein C3492_42535 [Streptomyces sp. Ru62]
MNTERSENSGAPEGRDPSPADPRSTTAEPGRTDGRRPTAVIVAVATAAVLLIGGGGAYLAAGDGTDGRTGDPAAPGAAHGTPPPLTLDGWARSGTGGVAPGEPDPYGARYVARGELPDGPGSAPVYEPGAEVGREQVVRLAKALGVDGAPVAEGRMWRVGGQDGSGPRLTVNRDAPGGWSFDRYAPGTDNCRKVTVCAQDPGAPAGDPVSVADAEKAAAPVLEAAGLDDAKLDASQVMGARRVVNADPVVGGLPTYGWTTGLTVDRGGELVGGHGLLATPVKGDTYPVVGAAKTLELMNGSVRDGHRMGIGGCASPEPLKDRLEQPCGASTGAPKAARDTVTVEKAVFGLAAHSVGGRQTLVPSWLFQVRGSTAGGAFTVTYPAVDPAYLTSASASPAPRPSQPSRAPGKSRSVKVNGYTVDGRTLNLSFYGGVCADYRTSARESGGRVTVTVTERPWPGRVCVLIAKEYVKTVTLDAPLDGRTVVGTDGKAVPRAKPGSLRPDASAQPR